MRCGGKTKPLILCLINHCSKNIIFGAVIERILRIDNESTGFLAFRGSKENIEELNKGNFLSVIELLTKYDPILSELLAKPTGSIKYLSHQIQNEVISLLGQEVHDNIVSDIKDAPFFSFILDTTQDASKIDQLSQVFCFVNVIYNDSLLLLLLKISLPQVSNNL